MRALIGRPGEPARMFIEAQEHDIARQCGDGEVYVETEARRGTIAPDGLSVEEED